MPSYYKKRRNAKKKSYYSRFKGVAKGVGMVAKLARDVYYLKSIVNVEKKYLDTTASTTSVQGGGFLLLNGLVQGTSATTRLGQSIKMISVYPNIFWTINAAATTTYCRMIIFIDKQPNGAAPIQSDILSAVNSVLAPMNVGNSKRFKILMDKRLQLSINGNEIVKYKRFRKLATHTEYNTGNTGGIADIQTNSIYLYHMSDQTVNAPTFSYNVRLRFIDN